MRDAGFVSPRYTCQSALRGCSVSREFNAGNDLGDDTNDRFESSATRRRPLIGVPCGDLDPCVGGVPSVKEIDLSERETRAVCCYTVRVVLDYHEHFSVPEVRLGRPGYLGEFGRALGDHTERALNRLEGDLGLRAGHFCQVVPRGHQDVRQAVEQACRNLVCRFGMY